MTRRKSSFNSSDSPYARRRSFLSKAMLENDTFQTYELSSYDCYSTSYGPTYSRIPSFSINLNESQGFIWNQDLFASSYQQVRAGLNPNSFQGDSKPVEVIDIIVDSSDEMDDDERTEMNYSKGSRAKNSRIAKAPRSPKEEISMNDDIFRNGADELLCDEY
ncbi:DEKNAAC105055 [Brettanomyces naardenensis]|uniref:DEKNAAC105055 n=1 Tax=Brettanomyces naardenensis TaxID=13370 RepID=A0A448YRW3_BRENA|nr:DEKNAAC105055 [Brettanomyces naardenensis]